MIKPVESVTEWVRLATPIVAGMLAVVLIGLFLSPVAQADVCSSAPKTIVTLQAKTKLQSPYYIATISVSGTAITAPNLFALPMNDTFQILDSPDGVTWCSMFGPQSYVLASALATFTTTTALMTHPMLRQVSSTAVGVDPNACGLNIILTPATTST